MPVIPAAAPTVDTTAPEIVVDPPESVDEATSLLVETLRNLWEGFVANLPLIGLGLLIVGVGWVVARVVSSLAARGLARSRVDRVVVSLVERLTKLLLLVAFVLLALSVAGVPVGAALAGLGIVGLAVAFAVQSILENFVAGILLIARKPIRTGEQVLVGEHEGTVDDIDLRVTRLIDYDGEMIIIPNGEVFRSTIVNLTRRGARRTRVVIGIDYRDDHNIAGAVIESAVQAAPGVHESPLPQARCIALGESSVDFEVRYWTDPDIASVVDARDAVLRGVKTAVEGAGMSIPWPIRTLSFDNELVQRRAEESAGRR